MNMNECPNCHFHNQPGAKFCVKCGTKLTGNSSNVHNESKKKQQPRSPQSDATNGLNNVFTYFVASVKHPVKYEAPGEKYLGYISLGVFTVLTWLVSFVLAMRINGGLANESIPYSVLHKMNGVFNTSLMGLGLIIALLGLLSWILGYVGIHFVMNNAMSLSEYTNEYGRFLNIGIILLLVGIIFAAVMPAGILMLIGLYLVSLAITISGWALTYEVLVSKDFGSIDRFYVLLVITVVVAIVAVVCVSLLWGSLSSQLSNLGQELIGRFMGSLNQDY
ncbi:zinc ribbon domain-containing protein [Fructilactobacillus fructivorans]|uniref:Zinc-ribbon domain-containing protein n=2 Tax=Fructilactobacillus fructivorans TaxID=1614 RepID=A0AAE6P2H0_9LACO|nr:hypothetical protein FC73_GL000971 [Fructilactobacillus fructivorans]KRN12428.1 hypothetical protein IV37_GL001205 [Fructilactobacillus fructivorans]KRN41079.1 hypothetical protein IV51_GL000824 [Fructilactobacillus fructivorans]QFX93108.1 zinc-ribbon domain-containing protein [Fructilactobacillus fructivorans]RDV64724.1 zinc ribbon domain-containing protein [Fructilactobacillus fructivorans]